MIDDRVVGAGHAHAVERQAGRVAGPHADVAHDHVVRAEHAEIEVGDADAFAGRGLAGDGEVRIADRHAILQIDAAGDVEHDGARPVGFDGGPQAAGAAVVEIGDLDDPAAAAAAGEAAVAFGAGKREMPDAEAPDVAFGDVIWCIGVHFVDAPVIRGERVGDVGGELRIGMAPAILGRRGVALATASASVPR